MKTIRYNIYLYKHILFSKNGMRFLPLDLLTFTDLQRLGISSTSRMWIKVKAVIIQVKKTTFWSVCLIIVPVCFIIRIFWIFSSYKGKRHRALILFDNWRFAFIFAQFARVGKRISCSYMKDQTKLTSALGYDCIHSIK